MRIVVTGALGHIGSALIRYLPLEFPGAEIIMIDNLHTQRYCSLFDLPAGNYSFIEADARTVTLPDHDVVVHLAAYTEPHAHLDWGHNYAATENVVRQCRRIIFPSTASILIKPFPHTAYAGVKAEEEVLIRNETLQHTIFRLGNLFGPSPGMRFHTVVSKFCWQAAMGQPLSIWRTALNQRRPYLDLTDVTRAICFAIRNEVYGTYNLVTQTATASDVVAAIEENIPVKLDIIERDGDGASQDMKAGRFGFEFTGDLQRGVDATIDLIRHKKTPAVRLGDSGGEEARHVRLRTN